MFLWVGVLYMFFNDLFMGGEANLSILFDLDYMTISNFNYNENLDTFNLVISWLFFLPLDIYLH